MHGITDPNGYVPADRLDQKVRQLIVRHRVWLLVVVLPTLLVAAYFGFFASNQYESEAHFLVRSGDSGPPQMPSIGSALGIGGGGGGSSQMAPVTDYLSSHDAVAALQRQVDIIGRFRRPEADLWSRLRSANPTPERLLSYYRGQVRVELDSDTGIAVLRVRSFRPEDSYVIANALLGLGEQRVNSLNQRAYDSTLGVAERQLSDAERSVATIQSQITAFRQHQGDFNPQVTGQARVELVASLQSSLAQARAQEEALQSALSPSSPQMVAARARVRALEQQVASEQALLASGKGNVATALGSYESLQMRQQFAGKRYDSAAAALDKAREQLIKQQLFVVRVVNPNMPVRALYPKTAKIVATTFFALVLAYGIGWLIVAGMKEHAA